ncbi:5-formyltetrahydrofolate cyclo-ligase (plasmid) [Legionella adelaidensis]|uniref:5-formyltetrahydrofolate cyclo-ligase n=1 Tax=Legionella adelaidensis TaxID=45056 RepID=A0A0W0R649_9GAMM|nr:5-formyltetrahydrofolate cyclo-ligase [Legionella adelaidensis]KTC66547.1 5-formyltetrahydrofolate cyclo-ligase [Legionella adelaidensis]VEH81172.1 5-formyltetrahydrofolate cyclo-ligase [Legionella adelaidensis]
MPDRLKQAQRLTLRNTRKNLSSEYQQKISSHVCNRIKNLHEYRYAKHIGLYQAANGEIDLSHLWASAPLQGKFCYFPKLNHDHSFTFIPATPSSSFTINRYGIAEPIPEAELHPKKLDIIFIPLVGFDSKGTRLGMGAGYYDRSLAHYQYSWLIGVAYEFQHIAFIGAQEWDVPLNAIITEKTTYWINK